MTIVRGIVIIITDDSGSAPDSQKKEGVKKMKKVIAIILTFAMLATMAFGLVVHAEDKMNYALDAITGGNAKGIQIEPGTEVFVLGWVVQTNGFSKLQYSIDDGTPVDGEGAYRERPDVHAAFPGYDQTLNAKPGFGLDSAQMKLPGMENLAAGSYTLKLIGVTADGSSTYEVLSIPVTVGTPEEVVTETFDVEINTEQFPAITTFSGEGCKIAADAGTAGKEAIYLSHAADPKTDEARHADYATVKLDAASAGNTVVRLTLVCPDHVNGAFGYILRYRVNNGEWKDADLSAVNDHFDFDYDINVAFNAGENTIDFAQGQQNDAGWRIDILRIAYNQPSGDTQPVVNYADKAISTGAESIGVWMNKDNPSSYVEFTTAGSFKSVSINYWASCVETTTGPEADWTVDLFKFDKNPEKTLAGSPLKSMNMHSIGDGKPAFSFDFGEEIPAGTYIIRFTVTNPDFEQTFGEEVKRPYLVLPKIDNPDTAKFAYSKDAFNLHFLAEDVDGEFFLANPENVADTEPVTEPETQPQTGDFTVAMFAVIAVLAMGAAVVFMKKRAF